MLLSSESVLVFARTFTYDAAGRTSSIIRGSGTTNFVYDFESRVTSISKPGMTTNTFTYNGLGTRVGAVSSSGTKTFKRSDVTVTAPVLSDGTATFTPSGENRSGVKTTYHSGLKNSDIQTSAAGAVGATKLFDAFGNELSGTGSWLGQFAYAGKFGYQHDADTGFKLLGHRYYDSNTGRFLTRDKAKEGGNWYIYCDNSPVLRKDKNGKDFDDFISAVGDVLTSPPSVPGFPELPLPGGLPVPPGGGSWTSFQRTLAASILNVDEGIDYESGDYQKGWWTGIALDLAIGGKGKGFGWVKRVEFSGEVAEAIEKYGGKGMTVIGRDAKRAKTFADAVDGKTMESLTPPSGVNKEFWWWKQNTKWIWDRCKQRADVLDVGLGPGIKKDGIYYGTERFIVSIFD